MTRACCGRRMNSAQALEPHSRSSTPRYVIIASLYVVFLSFLFRRSCLTFIFRLKRIKNIKKVVEKRDIKSNARGGEAQLLRSSKLESLMYY